MDIMDKSIMFWYLGSAGLVLGLFLLWSLCNPTSWTVHISQTKQYSKTQAYGTFNDFVTEFNRHTWNTMPDYFNSVFDYSTDSEIHASIVRFDGCGMLLGRIDWWRANRFLHRYLHPTKVGAWKERNSR